MHASIALCLMFVGGPIAPGPDPEMTFVPLSDWQLMLVYNVQYGPTMTRADSTGRDNMQELEWKARMKRGYKLPRLPSVADANPADDGRAGRRLTQPTDPNAPRRQQLMPMVPTDPGTLGQNGGGQMMPSVPGSGMNQDNSQGFAQGGNGRVDPYAGDSRYSKPGSGNYGGNYGNYGSPRAAATPGISPNVSGGLDKPYSNYQRPSGYSPWMRLYDTPTNGGTVSPYSAAVQPAFQQQQYNQQMAEQIQGVRSNMVGPRGGTPGTEMPVNGAGMANPNGYINYANPMGR